MYEMICPTGEPVPFVQKRFPKPVMPVGAERLVVKDVVETKGDLTTSKESQETLKVV